jgi:SAM-dependent methyltransferase
MNGHEYVHGYAPRENERLADQADALIDLLHDDTSYPAESAVLEAGCGIGAQTVTLARRSPGARITSIDISATSVAQASRRVHDAGLTNVALQVADVFDLPFADASFDHAFVCFVLEHLAEPVRALRAVARVLKPGGSITVIEGDHGSAFFHPETAAARAAIACQIELQRGTGGNAEIGRQVFPLVQAAGFDDVRVSPRLVYVDGSRPDLIDAFTRKTFTAMIAGVRDAAIAHGLSDAASFDRGIRDLERTATPGGVFSYCFFKAVATKPLSIAATGSPLARD